MSNELILLLISIIFFAGLYITITEEPKTAKEQVEEFKEDMRELGKAWVKLYEIINRRK